MHGFRNTKKLKAARRDAKAAGLNPPPQIDGPKPRRMHPCEYLPGLGYAIPFPGTQPPCMRCNNGLVTSLLVLHACCVAHWCLPQPRSELLQWHDEAGGWFVAYAHRSVRCV